MKILQQAEEIRVRDDVHHRCAIMAMADNSVLVDKNLGRQASQLEQPDLLAIKISEAMPGIGDADEGETFLRPVFFKHIRTFRPDRHDFRIELAEPLIILAQLRHVPAAEGSDEAPVEDQQQILLAGIVAQGD